MINIFSHDFKKCTIKKCGAVNSFEWTKSTWKQTDLLNQRVLKTEKNGLPICSACKNVARYFFDNNGKMQKFPNPKGL